EAEVRGAAWSPPWVEHQRHLVRREGKSTGVAASQIPRAQDDGSALFVQESAADVGALRGVELCFEFYNTVQLVARGPRFRLLMNENRSGRLAFERRFSAVGHEVYTSLTGADLIEIRRDPGPPIHRYERVRAGKAIYRTGVTTSGVVNDFNPE